MASPPTLLLPPFGVTSSYSSLRLLLLHLQHHLLLRLGVRRRSGGGTRRVRRRRRRCQHWRDFRCRDGRDASGRRRGVPADHSRQHSSLRAPPSTLARGRRAVGWRAGPIAVGKRAGLRTRALLQLQLGGERDGGCLYDRRDRFLRQPLRRRNSWTRAGFCRLRLWPGSSGQTKLICLIPRLQVDRPRSWTIF